MKELLCRHRRLGEHAKNKHSTKAIFLCDLTDDQAKAIRRILQIEPGGFFGVRVRARKF